MKRSLFVRSLFMSATMLTPSVLYAQQVSPPAQPTPPAPDSVNTAGSSPNAAPTPETAASGIADIVVTARRTAENLQSTPVAVTALGSQALEVAQIQDATDLQRVAPSFSIQTGGPSVSGLVFVSLRGQQNQNPGTANDPTVATYIDGVYIPRPSQGQTDLADIERLEVLRGPQGTLFGRNTTGGAINILTSDPKDYFEVLAKGQVGNYNFTSAGLTVNAPLGDGLAVRISGNYSNRDGYVRNPTLNSTADDPTSYFVRGKLKYEGEGLTITLSGDYNKINDNGQKVSLVAINPAVFTALPGGAAVVPILQSFITNDATFYQTNGTGYTTPAINAAGTAIFNALPANVQALYSQRPQNQVIAYGFGGIVQVDLGGDMSLKSITGYRYSNSTGLIDTDGTPVVLLATRSGYGSHQFSQELQLTGKIGSNFNYILGGYYGHEKGYESSTSQTFGFIPAPRFITENASDVTNVTKGIFGQGNLNLTEKLRVTAGLRWTFDDREVVLHNKSRLGDPATCTLPNPDVVGVCNQTQKVSFDYPAWTLGFDYQASDDVFLYAQTRGASKSGGFNVRAGSIPAFAPEKVRDVEVGAKIDWLDNRLRTNVALFHSWTYGLQKQIGALIPGTTQPTQYLINAGNARIYGAEFEVTAIPVKGLEINATLSLLDGQYERGTFTEVQRVNGVNVTVDRSGEPLPQLAKVQYNIGATQTIPIENLGDLRLHLDYSYISSVVISPVTAAPGVSAAVQATFDTQNRLTRVPGYGLLNGRVGLQIDDPNVEVFAFARNITGKKYVSRVFADLYTQGLGFVQQTVGDPFTFGGGVTVRFGGRGR